MSAVAKVEERNARARASRIRQGIHNYLETLGEISAAYREQDHLALGYGDWQMYVDGEFGAERLRLPLEHRQKAVQELRLAGMSTRAIGTVLGVDKKTVSNDLAAGGEFSPPDDVVGSDGKTYASSRPDPPPLVAAMAEEIQAVAERAQPADPWDGWSPDQLELLDRLRRKETVVVSMRIHGDLIAWAETNGLYERIDRRTEWGNPYEMPADGDRTVVIACYAAHYLPFKPSLTERLEQLRGKALGCWCAPEPCHGDVLKAAVEGNQDAYEEWAERAPESWLGNGDADH